MCLDSESPPVPLAYHRYLWITDHYNTGPRSQRVMDEEAIYEFDTCGWVLLRNILSADEVRSASAAASRGAGSDSSSLLDDHPMLQAAKLALIGHQPGHSSLGRLYTTF